MKEKFSLFKIKINKTEKMSINPLSNLQVRTNRLSGSPLLNNFNQLSPARAQSPLGSANLVPIGQTARLSPVLTGSPTVSLPSLSNLGLRNSPGGLPLLSEVSPINRVAFNSNPQVVTYTPPTQSFGLPNLGQPVLQQQPSPVQTFVVPQQRTFIQPQLASPQQRVQQLSYVQPSPVRQPQLSYVQPQQFTVPQQTYVQPQLSYVQPQQTRQLSPTPNEYVQAIANQNVIDAAREYVETTPRQQAQIRQQTIGTLPAPAVASTIILSPEQLRNIPNIEQQRLAQASSPSRVSIQTPGQIKTQIKNQIVYGQPGDGSVGTPRTVSAALLQQQQVINVYTTKNVNAATVDAINTANYGIKPTVNIIHVPRSPRTTERSPSRGPSAIQLIKAEQHAANNAAKPVKTPVQNNDAVIAFMQSIGREELARANSPQQRLNTAEAQAAINRKIAQQQIDARYNQEVQQARQQLTGQQFVQQTNQQRFF